MATLTNLTRLQAMAPRGSFHSGCCGHLRPLTALGRLRHLCLTERYPAELQIEPQVPLLLQHMPHLTMLDVCCDLGPGDIPSLPGLASLHIDNLSGLARLAEAACHLTHLRCRSGMALGKADLKAVLPELQEFEGNYRYVGRPAAGLVVPLGSMFPALRRLWLMGGQGAPPSLAGAGQLSEAGLGLDPARAWDVLDGRWWAGPFDAWPASGLQFLHPLGGQLTLLELYLGAGAEEGAECAGHIMGLLRALSGGRLRQLRVKLTGCQATVALAPKAAALLAGCRQLGKCEMGGLQLPPSA